MHKTFGTVVMFAASALVILAQEPQPRPPRPPHPPRPPRIHIEHFRDDSTYQRGVRELDARHWDNAVQIFTDIAGKSGTRADAALYWKAYALNKLGRRDDALAAIGELRKSYGTSRWLDDAKVLEAEVRQSGGQRVTPESETDEDLKLMAINSLVHSDPERAVPLLEKILKGTNSPRMKERALFVLTQGGSPRAREVLTQVARGGANPDLQIKAIHYLAVAGGKDSRQPLAEIYASAGDVNVRREILHSFVATGDRERLLDAAKNEKASELRRDAIHSLAALGAQAELWQLYQAEPSADMKQEIMRSFVVTGSGDKLLELARTEKDPKLRREAIRNLAVRSVKGSPDALVSLYGSEADTGVRREIINALMMQQNAKPLIDIARKESDPELKKHIVSTLSHMRSKEATDYLMEILSK